jgi:exoribonuclease R
VKSLLSDAPHSFEAGFNAIRRELDVPDAFPANVLEAARSARPAEFERIDARHIPFVAVDPEGATDLDQAFAAEANPATSPGGYRVFYAIADVGAFLTPGGPIDTEARKRGTTLYSPDLRTPLHPPVISEDRASLLPGGERPALLWTIDLGPDGEAVNARLERATVRVSEAISYAEAQHRADGSDELMVLLRTIGQLRQQQEMARGGVSLNLPSQEIAEREGNYTLEYRDALPIEGWNAQISLLTGIVAGKAMAEANVGILRTLPPTRNQDLRKLRRQAKSLGVDWPDQLEYPEMIRGVQPGTPAKNAFLLQAARSFRGAGYAGFNGPLPDLHEHGAIASIYGHVTAPLRRLVDRFANEILLSIYADQTPPAWAVEALDELPSLMGRARSRESALERATVDFAEACLLSDQVGSKFGAFVVDLDAKRDRATVQIAEPAIVANISPAGRTLAEELTLVLTSADTGKRIVTFDVDVD